MRALGYALSILLCSATFAPAAGPPRQATVVIQMPAADGETRSDTEVLEGGGAEVLVTATNNDDGRTVDVRLHFDYDIPPDTIAFDEIISRISFATISDDCRIGRARLGTGEINLNPNGPELHYRLTMYRSESPYRVRIRIFGNYE